jgi:outer membrane protease
MRHKGPVNTAVSSHYYSLKLVLDTLQNHNNLKEEIFIGYKETALFRKGGPGRGGSVSWVNGCYIGNSNWGVTLVTVTGVLYW